MTYSNLIKTGIVIATLGASALAGEKPQLVKAVQPQQESKLSMDISMTYATDYAYKGLLLNQVWNEGENALTGRIAMNYNLTETTDLVGSFSYTDPAKDKSISFTPYHLQEQLEGTLGLRSRFEGENAGLTAIFGWKATHGGMEGLWSKVFQENSSSAVQRLFLNLNHDIGNFHVGLNTSYAFSGMNGWWFEPYMAYNYTVSDSTDIRLRAGMNVTTGYFGAKQYNADGTQSFYVNLSVPVKLNTKGNVTLTPFMEATWAGAAANKRSNAPREFNLYRDNAVVGGIQVSYSF